MSSLYGNLDDPVCYKLIIEITDVKNDILDRKEENFGMRTVEVKDGNILLNRKPVFLKGANLWQEVSYTRGWQATEDLDFAKHYLIDVPKWMNLSVFRTHLGPMNRKWLDVCDQNGMMIISEFPIALGAHNYKDPEFADHVLKEYMELLPLLWNHPSIIIWSIANESWEDGNKVFEYENSIPLFKKYDPTRPVMRAGDVSPDFADIHTYEGVWYGTMADFEKRTVEFASKHSEEVYTNTEYLETGSDVEGMFYNKTRAKRFMGENISAEGCELIHAQLAMEQTEILRALGYKIILPYWYSDWVNDDYWVSGFQTSLRASKIKTDSARNQKFNE